jgi:hypothetical protein
MAKHEITLAEIYDAIGTNDYTFVVRVDEVEISGIARLVWVPQQDLLGYRLLFEDKSINEHEDAKVMKSQIKKLITDARKSGAITRKRILWQSIKSLS